VTQRPTSSEQRMAELCAIRDRSLKLGEQMDVKRLRLAIYNAQWKRQRYANDPAYRETVKARAAAYKARRRSGGGDAR